MDIKQIKQARPEWSTLSDSQVVDMVHQLDYPDLTRDQVAQGLGVKLEAPKGAAPAERPLFSLSQGSALNDYVTEGVNAAAGGVSSAANFIVPGNRVSKAIDQFVEDSQANFTDVARQGKQQLASDLESADGFGEEAAAALKYVAQNPGLALSQAVGSFAGPGAAIKGARMTASGLGLTAKGVARAGLGAGAATGGAMAGGDAAGTAYDLVIKAGGTPEQAEAAAREASMLPAAIGAAGGLVGAERVFAGAKGFAGNAASRALKTGAVEGLQEGIEEGVTQYEGQRAAMPYDPSIDPMKGVGGAATLGVALGAATGAGVSALEGPPRLPNNGPLSRGANLALDRMDVEAAQAGQPAPGLSEGQYNQAMDGIMAQGDADMKAMKQAGFMDKGPSAYANAAGAPAMGVPGVDALAQSEQPFDALADRIMTTRETLADEGNRQAIREKFGDQALQEALYYLNQADRPGQIPDKTRDNMLAMAEEIVSRSRLTPVQQPGGLGAGAYSAPERLGADVGLPQIGLDTEQTGVFRADAAGNVAPETNADRINTRQAAAAKKDRPQGGPGMDAMTPRDTMRGAGPGVMVGDGVLTPAERPARQQPAAGPVPRLVYRPNGEPFKNQRAAVLEQRRVGGDVVPVEGGWAVQTQDEALNEQDQPASTQATAAPQVPQEAADPRGTGQAGAGEQGNGVPGTRSGGDVQADGMNAGVRLFGSTGYQLTMADAVKKVAELEKDAREAKKRANNAPTKIMQKVEDDESARASGLARQLRNDIKYQADSYPDARREYEEAKQEKQGAGKAQVQSQADGVKAAQIFTGKSALFEGFGASKGSVSEGARRQLMVDPSGGYFWGDWRQENQRDVGAVAGGADRESKPAAFSTSKEAREAAESTPETKDKADDQRQPAVQADGLTKTPDFLKTKTVPEMTDEELKQAQAFYGPNHKRAKTIAKEMAKRAPKVPAVAEPALGSRLQRLKTELAHGGKVVDGILRQSNGMEIMKLDDAELAQVPADKKDTSEAIKARRDALLAKDEGKARKDDHEPAARQAGEVVGEDKEVQEVKALLLPELRAKLSDLADRAFDAGDGAMSGRIRGFTLGMKETDSSLSRTWVNEVVADFTKRVERLEKKAAPKAAKAEEATKPSRPQQGEPGYTIEMAEQDLDAMRSNTGEFGGVLDDRVADRIKRQEKLIAEMKAEAEPKKGPHGAPNEAIKPETLAEALQGLEDGKRVILYAGTDFEQEVWLDRAKSGTRDTYVFKTREKGSSVVFTKGPVGADRQWGWGRGDAAREALKGVTFANFKTGPVTDDLAADPEMAAYERGQTAETRLDDRQKVSGAGRLRERIKQDSEARRAAEKAGADAYQSGADRRPPDEMVKPAEREAWIKGYDTAPPAGKQAVSANTIFTEDAAAKAREILRKKLGQMNSGLDPEMMQAGITLAGYHIEKGARTFAAYAKAMLEDLGDSVRPYLKSWYMGVKYDPRAAGLDGMSTAAEVESANVDPPANTPVDQPAQAAQTADETTSEQDDERRNLRGQGPQALDEVAAQDDSQPQERGQVQRSAADGGQERPADGAGVDAAGVSAERGRGSRAGAVRVPEAGAGRRADRLGDAGAGRARKAVPLADGRAKRPGSAEPAVTPAAPNVPAQNFRITSDLRLGRGGEVEKFNDNLNAIRTLKTLEAERRRATPDEQRILARYVGWGGLANAFPDPMTGEFKDKWKARGEELRSLLSPKEYTDARRSTRNAHYTSEVVVSAMWDAARRLGFRGGLVLENSMGTGNFLGLKPEDLPGKFIGVEYDNLTSRIAQALYPQAAVLNSGFQKVPVADNAFALNIGNPPFGSESLRFQFKPELQGASIHNQFFRAGMDAVRPGGLQIKVVSRFLMDAQDKSTRVALARQADLVAAIRLPDTAFKENARTEVVTDIIILRKLTPAEQAAREQVIDNYLKPNGAKDKDRALVDKAPAWIDVDKVRDPLGGEAMTVNRYFAQNPAQIMGVMERSGSMQHSADITVRLDDPTKLESMLRDAVARLPEKVSNIPDEVLAATEERFSLLADALRISVANEEVGHMKFDEGGSLARVIEREAPDGGFIMSRQQITPDSPWSEQLSMDDQGRWYKLEVEMGDDGKPVKALNKEGKATKRNVYKRTTYANEADVPDGMRLGKAGYERLQGLVELRDLLKKQLVLETEDAKASVMEGNRKKLADAYARFVAAHGPVNRSTNMALAMTMPDGGLVTALEVGYQPERSKAQAARSGLEVQGEKATPAPILRERVVPKYEPPTNAATAADALAISLAERGRVDIERIAALRGVSPEAVVSELQSADKPLVFSDPESETWETADAYLSGMVRRKLNAARDAAARDPRFEVNVKALEAVQPEAWTAENVTAQMGATWVPGDVYADFVKSLVGGKASVSFSAVTNSFSVNVREAERTKAEQWSTEGAPADYIVTRLLNSRPVVVTYKDENGSMKVDQERTALAQLKAKEIVAEFGDWVFKDGDRRQRLVDLFNEKFNTRVNRQFDGSHLMLPGKVPDAIIQMRRHQKNAIWRGIASRFLLLDHVVGAGKTFTGIARAMERRRMGLARKPMIVVPNHLVEQWAADVYRLYPGAKVLAAGQKDFEAKRRRRLFGKIATGDWDIVIVPHSSFGFIGISPETEMRYLEQEMEQAKAAIKEAEEQAQEDGHSGFRKPFGVKEAERLAEKIQTRIDKLQSGVRDRLLTFEQLGVDDLTVDEAHEFKNLFYSSRLTGVRGMGDKTSSRKAADLYNKVRVMREGGGAVTFMTGTPISNSAVEMYTMMRYLAADELKEQGLEHFDAWRAQSVEASAAFEPTESGRLKEVTRLGRTWANMRSLMDTYYGFTDAVSIEDIKKWFAEDNNGKPFPVPKVKGGDRTLVKVKPTQAQEGALKEIIAGFDGLDGIKDPYERNAARLRLMDRARKVSLDIRAVDAGAASKEEGGKLERVSQEIKRIYDKSTADRGTQLVFLDRSVPKAKGDDKIVKEYDELVAKRDKALKEGNEDAFQSASDALEKFDSNEITELRNAQTSGWNAYQQIKDNLVAMGIPAAEIRFVQEAQNDEQKAALFDAVRGGKVRVLLGSTPRMGAGTNVQDRLVGLHHVDVTWKPSDIEQREGRIIRQGNKLLEKYGPDGFEVEIMAYATERTVDAKMWDLNAQKLRMINGIRKYDGAFSMEFEDEESVSMAEMAALASGNPLLLERVTLESQIGSLELQERAHRRKMYGVLDAIQSAERALRENPERIRKEEERGKVLAERVLAVEKAQAGRAVSVEGVTYTDQAEAMRAALAAVEAQQDGNQNARYAVTIDGKRATSKEAINDAVGAALGDSSPFLAKVGGAEYAQRTSAGREVARLVSEAKAGLKGAETITLGEMFGYKLVADLEPVRNARGDTSTSVDVHLIDGERTMATAQASVDGIVQMPTAQGRKLLEQLEGDIQRRADYAPTVKYMQGQMERAERDLPSLLERKKEEFPKAKELTGKRARLEEVVRALSADAPAATEPDQTAFSRDGSQEGFRRQDAIAAIAHMDMVEDLVRQLTGGWKNAPEIVVLRSMDEAPEAVRAENARQVANGATGEPEAFYHRGKAYLLASHMRSMNDVRRAVFHEVLGHLGMRGLYGTEIGEILDQVARARRGDVEAKARQYGLNMKNARDKQIAAEEWLAEIAQDNPQLGFVRRAVAAIRSWLRRNVPAMSKMRMTDDEIIRELIVPVQRFIKEGPPDGGKGLIPAFRRDQGFSRGEGSRVSVKRNESGERVYAAGGVMLDAPIESERFEVIPGPGQKILNYAIMPTDSFDVLGNMEVLVENGQPVSILDITVDGRNKGVGAKAVGMLLAAHPKTDMNVSNIIPAAQGFWEKMGIPAQNREEGAAYDGTINHATYLDAQAGRGAQGVLAEDQGQNRQADTRAEGSNPQALGGSEVGFSRTQAAQQFTGKAREAVQDFFGSAGAQVDWLDRTFKTQYAKAQKFPAFRAVFNKLQDYIEGVSTLANEAADNAPSILPKLENWRDLAKTGLKEADAKAVAAPIFEGTLSWTRVRGQLVPMDEAVSQGFDGEAGVVFTDKELRDQFKLTDEQIGYYREFRAAVDESLDQLVSTEVIRLLGNVPPAVKAMAMTRAGRAGLRDAISSAFENQEDPLLQQINDKFDHINRMKARGYAPLSRFGKFWVHVVDQDGQTQYFGMEESRSQANRLARTLREEFPGATVEQGVMSQEFHKLMSAVPVDAMELFASAIGADQSEVFQKYIQLAKNNRSTMKRLIKRKGTSGFSDDVPRVLASFVTSNARAASTALNIKDAKDLARDIRDGDVKDEAIKLIESVTEPEESGAAIRSVMFTNFIGGSIASAVVNVTQPFMMTLPYLSQWGGALKAGGRLVDAARMIATGVDDSSEIGKALKRAEIEGVVSPQEIHHLIDRAAGGIGSKNLYLKKLALLWSGPFSVAEQFNRRVSFLAAYQTAKAEGIANPFGFAEKAVIETQGLYNAGNKPNVARGAIGATAMTFKQYSIHYLEWLARMAKSGPDGKKAAALALVLLMMAAGTDGLPFMDDMDDVFDTVGQAMGYDTNTKRARREAVASVLGEELAEVATRGFSAAAGFPVDLSIRMGMGNLLPATDLLLKSNTDTARSLAEIAGPGGSMFTQYRDAARELLSGDIVGAIQKASPVALQNLMKAAKMAETGEYRDQRDRKVTDVDGLDVGMKALSFQPAQIARESTRMSEARQSETLAKAVENEITDKWARAIADGDREAEKEALKMRDDWNEKNPGQPIVVKRSQAVRKARNMKMERRDRFLKTVSPERRAMVDKEIS